MTKRTMWWLTCLMFAAMWGILGLVLWPFLALAVMSLMMIMIPVGVPDRPPVVHNPTEWRQHGPS
jgi:hypothetical protein